MKHQKEWHTCDRCGKEIKAGLLGTNSITRNGVLSTTYDLCNECMTQVGKAKHGQRYIVANEFG